MEGARHDTGSIIEAARRGEAGAQEEIAGLIRSFAHHVCRGGRGSGIPELGWEDVAQEASKRFFTVGIERFRAGGPDRSYLYAVVRSAYLQLSRSAWRRKQRELEGQAHGGRSPNPETRTLLYRVLSRLSDACQELLQRLYFDGATYAELAVEVGLSESSVRARASRCLGSAREVVC